MALLPGLPRWAGIEKVNPISILLKQETVSGSGISWDICKSAPRSRQITMPAPHRSVFYRPDAFPAAQPTTSKHWRQDSVIASKLENAWQKPSTFHFASSVRSMLETRASLCNRVRPSGLNIRMCQRDLLFMLATSSSEYTCIIWFPSIRLSVLFILFICLTFTNIDNKNIVRTWDCRTARQNDCTYWSPLKHTNNDKHNNRSQVQIRISAQETGRVLYLSHLQCHCSRSSLIRHIHTHTHTRLTALFPDARPATQPTASKHWRDTYIHTLITCTWYTHQMPASTLLPSYELNTGLNYKYIMETFF